MNNKGFTLIELTVTLALLGIMAAISIPSYFSWLPRHRLQTSVRHIYDDMNMARSMAVKNNTAAVAIFDISSDTYTVFLDASSPLNWTLDAGEIIVTNGTLENSVDIYGSTDTTNKYGFNTRGLRISKSSPPVAFPDYQVYLKNSSGVFMGVRVTIAGSLSIINSTDEGTTWS